MVLVQQKKMKGVQINIKPWLRLFDNINMSIPFIHVIGVGDDYDDYINVCGMYQIGLLKHEKYDIFLCYCCHSCEP